jgi:hypothetical protein
LGDGEKNRVLPAKNIILTAHFIAQLERVYAIMYRIESPAAFLQFVKLMGGLFINVIPEKQNVFDKMSKIHISIA